MAGSNPRFNAARFRDAIQSVYSMGMSPDEEQQATFFFPSQLVYVGGDGDVDERGVPFDPETTVQRVQPPPVRVPCAVEYQDESGNLTPFGVVQSSRVKITLLDEDYEKVKGCTHVVIGGDRYDYRRTEPPKGLFDVGLYTMVFAVEQET